ncbi:putative NBD/HSP70 family sugar kinase [Lachnospiraceae bacterium PF1-21]|uniref:ROK family transcriptional regulator n=1 Tax=Ohessyouella blattaphilus TaxID=2949333 RepID=UPI003E2215F9
MIYENIIKTENKQSNRNRIYQLVYLQGKISKPDIATQLGISLPTALQNVKELQAEGLLQEGSPLQSTGGRRAVAVTCTSNARYSIGIDITRNHVRIVIINLMAEIVSSLRIQKIFQNTTDYFSELGNLVDGLIKDSKINPELLLGVGFSVPGVISSDGLLLVYSHVLNVSGLQCSQMKRYLPFPAMLCNDANAAGYAEMWSDRNNSNALYLALSNSVGGAIILNNNLYRGENQRAGEFGHMTLVRDGLPCYCGRNGCMDSYCSAQVLSQHTDGNLDLFFQKLRDGDIKIQNVWKEYLEWLAMAINNLTVSLDCKVILGGYLGSYFEEYLNDLRRLTADISTFDADSEYINVCKYKHDAAAVGAALLFVRPFIEQI